MPKLKEEKQRLMEQLICDKVFEAAKELMAREDVGVFTMTELSERIGVAKGTLYNYFTDKYAVILYVCNRLNEEYMDKVKSYFDQHPNDYENNLRYLYRFTRKTIKENRFIGVAKLYFHLDILEKRKKSKTDISALEAPIFKDMMIQNRRFFTEFFENGKKQGVFKDLNPKVMASFIDIYLLGVESYSFLREKTLFDTEQSKSAFPEIEEMIVSAVCKKQK